MSAMGQKQTSRHVRVMSVIPLKADINQRGGGKEKETMAKKRVVARPTSLRRRTLS